MGRDIHIVLERKNDKKKGWVGLWSTDFLPHSLDMIIDNRNTDLFNEIIDKFEIFTSVNDFSDLSNMLIKKNYRHSLCVLTIKEFTEVFKKHNCNFVLDYINKFPEYYLYGTKEEENFADYRLVVNFDN